MKFNALPGCGLGQVVAVVVVAAGVFIVPFTAVVVNVVVVINSITLYAFYVNDGIFATCVINGILALHLIYLINVNNAT